MNWDWSLDGWIIATGSLCAVAAALLGNFLVLRKMSMLGDAVSHAVLPGLAIAFFVSQSRSSLPMFIGAAVVGILTALFTEWIKRFGRVDESAAMGVVFTSLFAAGLVMIVQAADKVDLDAGCVLYGAIELTADDTIQMGQLELPRAFCVLSVVTLVNAIFLVVCYKELKITSFDPATADAMGISARWMHYLLMILVAITAVASFESVGNILVVAMMIVPPATAFLLTRRLNVMIQLSVLIAIASAISGHWVAINAPRWAGFSSTTTAGTMAAMSGVFFATAVLLSPDQGVVFQASRRFATSLRILTDDIAGFLYRIEERGESAMPTIEALRSEMFTSRWMIRLAIYRMQWSKEIVLEKGHVLLMERGRSHAMQLVRSHRLWEQYLVTETSAGVDRIHDKAEKLEHFTDRRLRERLDEAMDRPDVDPHGSTIPPERKPQ